MASNKIKYSILCILFLMQGLLASAQIAAMFTASDTSGCGSLLVQFNNQSTGSGTLTYTWDFGNGITSTLENPQIYFPNSGLYSIQLIVSNGSEKDTIIRHNYIHIFEPPTADFMVQNSNIGCQGASFAFINNSLAGDTTLHTYTWDFGDNSYNQMENPTHAYQQAGNYTIVLFISDLNGCESSVTQTNLIQVKANPVANFTATNNISCFDTATVFFTNHSTGVSTLKCNWGFGDGQNAGNWNPTHVYQGLGTYTVKLRVTDNLGCTDSLIKRKLVQMKSVKAAFLMANDIICPNTSINFANLSIGADQFRWTFSDGSTSNEKEPIVSFNQGGYNRVQLIASYNNYCADTATKTFWVDAIRANFITDTHYACEIPFVATYENRSMGASTYLWHFGNGQSSNDTNPEITYSSNDSLNENYTQTYTDTLIATSSFGCADTLIAPNNVTITLPKIYFTPNDTSPDKNNLSGCTPLNINFINQSISTNPDESFTQFAWDFGNGNQSTEVNPTYTYTEPGDYTVELKVTNTANCVNNYTAQVEAGTVQNPDFQISGDFVHCGSDPVAFVNTSTDLSLIDNSLWIFSDSETSTLKNPVHTFTDTGYASASLTVFYNGCKSETLLKDSVAYIKGPAGKFNFAYQCEHPLDYQFISALKGVDSIFWDFGDQSYDSSQNSQVMHSYAQTGNYLVKLSGKNAETQCESVVELSALPRQIHSSFTLPSQRYCLDDSILFDGSPSTDEGYFWLNKKIGRYLWSFDNDSSVLAIDMYYHKFQTTGTHSVNLLVTDQNGCANDTTINLAIYKPNADFLVDTALGCSPMTVQLSNLSSSDTLLNSWQWYVDNSLVNTDYEPSIQISDTGMHLLMLIARDIMGCSDTATSVNAIFTSRPQPALELPALLNCQYDSLSFKNLSVGNIANTIWFFGDGNQSNQMNPVHAYIDTGYFHLQLYLQDALGCDTTYSYSDSIYIEPLPIPDFTASVSNPLCYPALVNFSDVSMGKIQTWKWNFGDNSPENPMQNPMHTYYVPGTFPVELEISTQIGCKNKILDENAVTINGPNATVIAPDSACIHQENWFVYNQGINIFSWEWLFNDGMHSVDDSVSHAFDQFGWHTYRLILRSDNQHTCDKTFTDSVWIPELITDFTLNDSVGCMPLSIDASNTSVGQQEQYWFLNNQFTGTNANQPFIIENAGIYQLKLLINNTLGCLDSLQKSIRVYPLPHLTVSNDTAICLNDTISIWAQGASSYKWMPENWILTPNQNHSFVFPKETSRYIVTATDTNYCKASDSLLITVQQMPQVQILNQDTTLIIGESIALHGKFTEIENFYWWPSDFIDCPSCFTTLAKPEHTTNLYLTGTDALNCFEVSDSVLLNVDIKFSLAMPSAFTPNGDGINDLVFVNGWGIQELLSFEVYNKYGLKVFITQQIEQAWDGKYKGSLLAPDVYYYKITVLLYDGQSRTKTGEIYLLK
jgi:gliding motility-associated-like protein